MDAYLIVAQSITQAQHMQRALYQVGIPSRIVRGHRAISPQGCGYTLQIRGADLEPTVQLLRREGFWPFRVYAYGNGRYQEVVV